MKHGGMAELWGRQFEKYHFSPTRYRGVSVSRGTWKLQLPGKYDSASQDIDACDHSLEVWKSKLNDIFFRFVPHWRGWSYQQLNKLPYSDVYGSLFNVLKHD